jgi:hypothetical protein
MAMERNLKRDFAGKETLAFNIEAALTEQGPKTLIIIPSDGEYLVYDTDETFIASIKPDEENEWSVVEGDITRGIADTIGREIKKKS